MSVYIVTVSDGAAAGDVAEDWHLQGCQIVYVYPSLSRFAADIPDGMVADVKADERVTAVRQNREGTNVQAQGEQATPPWHLDRIDQRDLPLDGWWQWRYDGTGVTIYCFDSWVNVDHTLLAGRATVGFRAWGAQTQNDWYAHGTSVASLAVGDTTGVARGAQLVEVNPFSNVGNITVATILACADWIITNHTGRGVVFAPWNWYEPDTDIGAAFTALMSAGLLVVNSAGNANAAVADRPPANVAGVVVVGGLNNSDGKGVSSFGPLVTIWAPGDNLFVATTAGGGIVSDTATTTVSGTSGACPVVAGVCAQLWQQYPAWTAAQVRQGLLDRATRKTVRGDSTDAILFSPDSLWSNPTSFTGITQQTYADSTVEPNTWYRYRVVATDAESLPTGWVVIQAASETVTVTESPDTTAAP
jgi:aqualysin 1